MPYHWVLNYYPIHKKHDNKFTNVGQKFYAHSLKITSYSIYFENIFIIIRFEKCDLMLKPRVIFNSWNGNEAINTWYSIVVIIANVYYFNGVTLHGASFLKFVSLLMFLDQKWPWHRQLPQQIDKFSYFSESLILYLLNVSPRGIAWI